MKIVNLFVCFVLALALLTGCATIVSKSDYPVSISSQPQGADITVVNRAGKAVFSGKTPTTITLKAGAGYFKGENYFVTFKNEGFTMQTVQVERGIDGWYIAGNLVFGGLIGWLIVDPATGSMWTLKNLHVDMSSQSSSIQNGMRLVTIDEVPDRLRPEMVRIK